MTNVRRLAMVAATAFPVALVILGGPIAAEQRPGPTGADLLVGGRSFEQPQLSQYTFEVPADLGAEILPVMGNVYMIARQSGNVVVQVGRDGVFVVDPGAEADAPKTLQAIRIITKAPIGYILNTTGDRSAYGGNERIAAAGQNPTVAPSVQALNGPGAVDQTVVVAGAVVGGGAAQPQRQDGAIIFAHENLLNRLSAPTGATAAEPVGFWPTNTFFTLRKTVFYNDEAIEIIHEPSAHTDGDLMAFFRRSDAIAAGPIIDTLAYPVPDARRGGSISGIL